MDRKTVDETKIYDEVLKQSLNDSGRQDSLIDIPPDVYRLIRSAEIRDYFRKNDCMGIFMKEQIILHSYTSMQQKTEMLKRLSHTGSEEENRLVEAGVNLKVVQDTLGHKDFSTTMDIYTDVTKELKQREFDNLQEKMNQKKYRGKQRENPDAAGQNEDGEEG